MISFVRKPYHIIETFENCQPNVIGEQWVETTQNDMLAADIGNIKTVASQEELILQLRQEHDKDVPPGLSHVSPYIGPHRLHHFYGLLDNRSHLPIDKTVVLNGDKFFLMDLKALLESDKEEEYQLQNFIVPLVDQCHVSGWRRCVIDHEDALWDILHQRRRNQKKVPCPEGIKSACYHEDDINFTIESFTMLSRHAIFMKPWVVNTSLSTIYKDRKKWSSIASRLRKKVAYTLEDIRRRKAGLFLQSQEAARRRQENRSPNTSIKEALREICQQILRNVKDNLSQRIDIEQDMLEQDMLEQDMLEQDLFYVSLAEPSGLCLSQRIKHYEKTLLRIMSLHKSIVRRTFKGSEISESQLKNIRLYLEAVDAKRKSKKKHRTLVFVTDEIEKLLRKWTKIK